ncbi:MAG: lysine biosynthesis protein LysW [Promethearchaeota archaeon]
MTHVECPECCAEIDAPEDVMVGEILDCPDCGVEVEVKEVNGNGIEICMAEIEGEDWGE